MRTYVLAMLVALLAFCAAGAGPALAEGDANVTEGTLRIVDGKGKPRGDCPLKHTDVKAEISGFLARVTVTQEFVNPTRETIEAVYTFPLPQNAAVDDMTMFVGSRKIRAEMKKRAEARAIYEEAKRTGRTAALLDQERPNIFTQAVANIVPAATVKVTISYVEIVGYEDGTYEFVFPMVVGPRYISGSPAGQSGGGWSPDTDKVPDASKITPPVAPKGTRAGHDVSVEVKIDAGVPIRDLRSVLHKLAVRHAKGSPRATVSLARETTIPNKDFILQYATAGAEVSDALLTHARKQGGGFFTFLLQPPKKPTASQVTPKEMIFVIDTSGSQMGWPIEKAKETMKYCIENMNPGDTFNLMAFSSSVVKLFDSPQGNTDANRGKALDFLAHRLGSGGTEMLPAVLEALTPPADGKRLRIVCFMTDGYVGSDFQILDAVKKHIGGARFFSFGVGNSVNRYLLEKMAELGRGEVETVTLSRHGDEVAEKFQARIGTPLMTDIEVGFRRLEVKDVYPTKPLDLFSGKPIYVTGRYFKPGKGEIVLKGKVAGKSFTRVIEAEFPAVRAENGALASLWARKKIDHLMSTDLKGMQVGSGDRQVEETITQLGLEFRLMTQFTSFVAVEDRVVNEGGQVRTVAVPVEMPDGVSHEGVFGQSDMGSSSGSGKGVARKRATFACAQPASTSAGSVSESRMNAPAGYAVSVGGDEDDYTSRAKTVKAADKLDASLSGLAGKVEKAGGSLACRGFEVRDYRLRVVVTLSYCSERVLASLRTTGLTVESYSSRGGIVKGAIDVRKLEALAGLQAVAKIEPLCGKDGGAGHPIGRLWLAFRSYGAAR